MQAVRRLSETDAPARSAARGTMLRAIVGLVVAVLLLIVGLPRDADLSAPSSRVAPAFVHTAMSKATASKSTVFKATVSKSDAIHAPLHTLAPNAAEADDGVGRTAFADPLSHRLPRLSSGTGFRPRGRVVVPAWASVPPDRPPRHA